MTKPLNHYKFAMGDKVSVIDREDLTNGEIIGGRQDSPVEGLRLSGPYYAVQFHLSGGYYRLWFAEGELERQSSEQ